MKNIFKDSVPGPKYKKYLFISTLIIFISFVFTGFLSAYLGLTKKLYESISPPNTFFNFTSIDFFARFSADYLSQVGDFFVYTFLLFIPLLIVVFFITYCFLSIRQSTIRRALMWVVIFLPYIAVMYFIFFCFIPGNIISTVYRFKVSNDIKHARKLFESAKIENNYDIIRKSFVDLRGADIYADYGSGGAFLALLIGEIKNRKLTYYESLYLPIFFSRQSVLTENSIADNSPLFMINGSYLIFGNQPSKDLLKKTLPDITDKLIQKKFGSFIFFDNRLDHFEIFDESEYSKYYKAKLISDTEELIRKNTINLQQNMDFLANYNSTQLKYDADYKTFVTDLANNYEDGCVNRKKYNNCEKMAQTLSENKVIMAQNLQTIKDDYEYSKNMIAKLNALINEQNNTLQSYKSGNSDVENKSKYSRGVTLGYDTIYLAYSSSSPMSIATIVLFNHELLHLYSFKKSVNGYALPEALNEGLTDYITYKTFGYSDLDGIRASGYKLEVQVILALLEKIPEDELLTVYFKQDTDGLKKLMNQYFKSTNYNAFMDKYQEMFDTTYHLHGDWHDFSKRIIDHPEVQIMRDMLGLEKFKFNNMIF